MWETLKQYIPVSLHWDMEGETNYNQEIIPNLIPTCLFLEAGGTYVVDQVRRDGLLPSYECGGYGVRYTVRTSCEIEENYDKVFYLYYEGYGQLGRWRLDDQYVPVDVVWDERGAVTPICIYLNDNPYIIGKRGILQAYPMSTRKTDGSGMRYIVKATCRQLHDYNREFSLLLEHGSGLIGRWFYEDADVVHHRKVLFRELDDCTFNPIEVEECMGVTNVCARYQITKEISNFLREWNSREHNGIWLSPEVFEKKIEEGIIYPKYHAPVMVAGSNSEVDRDVMQWGLKRPWKKNGVIFNLRCDNMMIRDTFASIKGNRCVVPCGGFYEYEKDGNKVLGDYLFHNQDGATLYMAGLYEQDIDGRHYSILTTDSNPHVDIHNRMPVILQQKECKAWLTGRLDFSQVQDRSQISLCKRAM